jgi:hypothetical protein
MAAVITGLWSLAPLGAALTIAGIFEARWWNSDDEALLFRSFTLVLSKIGLAYPLILRGPTGPSEIIVTGVLLMGIAALAPPIRRGSRAAVTSTIWLGTALLILLLVQIVSQILNPSNIDDYLAMLPVSDATREATVGFVQALLPPAWYSWVEDISQGAAAVMLAVAVIAAVRLHFPTHQPLTAGRSEPTDAYGQAVRRVARGQGVE